MQQIFDTLINSFIENQIGISHQFLPTPLANDLRKNLVTYFQQSKMKLAGIGNDMDVSKNKLFRSDEIYWLDRLHNNPSENTFFDLMDNFVSYLNQQCYTGITGYEFHYTRHEVGSFYKKHIDQFQNNNSRKYSMIFYLNEGWKQEDGGELYIHSKKGNQCISPQNGKSVFFQSNELEHEVLVTHKPRLSITGWLKVG